MERYAQNWKRLTPSPLLETLRSGMERIEPCKTQHSDSKRLIVWRYSRS